VISRRAKMAWLYGASLSAAAACLAAVVAAPLLMAHGSKNAMLIYAFFSPLCHQRPDRSFFLAGFPLAVCARCLGIYGGACLGLAARPLVRSLTDLRPPRTALFLAASLPLAVDAVGNGLRLWNSPGWLRFSTGLVWGPFLPYYFLSGIGSLFASPDERK
jgi:uncharacterized membrane protein